MECNPIFTILAAIVSASGAVVWLAKILSKHLLSMDLERFKADLKATNETEVERLRADLRIAAFQQETTFARLHDKRVEVIAELYGKLMAVHCAMVNLLNPLEMDPGSGRQEREKKAAEDGNEFARYYKTHQIYFEEHLCDLLDRFNQDMVSAWVVHSHNPTTGAGGQDRWDKRTDAWQHLIKQTPTILKEIQNSFRKLLGFSLTSTTLAKAE